MTDLILYKDLWEDWARRLPKWDRDSEFFNVKEYLRFAVWSGMSPQVVEPFFVEIIREIASRAPKPYKHILLPREHTKSSILCSLSAFLLAYPDQQIWGPRLRIAFDAEVKELSERNTGVVMQALETNPTILEEVGCQKPDKDFLKEEGISKTNAPWNIRRFKTLHCIRAELKDGASHAEPSGITVSSQKSTTGRHYEFRLGDDPVTGKTADSEAMKKKARKVHMEMQSQLSIANSLQAILGTRHADDDIHWSIQTDWAENFTFQCRTVWDDGPELYKDDFVRDEEGLWKPKMAYEEVKLLWSGVGQLEQDAKAGGFPADENVRKKRALHYLRSRMDDYDATTWTRNMLNRSMPDTDRVYRGEMFKVYDKSEFRHGEVLTYILTDAASGRDFRSSYRVVAVVSMDRQDTAFVRHVEYGLWTPTDFSKKILDAYRRYPTRCVVLEEMSWRETVEANLMLQAQVQKMIQPRVMIAKGINAMSKRGRVEAMEPRFTNGKILFSPDLKVERDLNGKTKFDEIVSQFMKIQDIDTQPKLKVDVADALSLIDSLDEKGQRICRPPRPTSYTRSEAEAAAALNVQKLLAGGGFRPGQSAAVRLALAQANSAAKDSQRAGKRSMFGGHMRTLGKRA